MKHEPMSKRDHIKACEALIAWFESQEIDPANAVPILQYGLLSAVLSVAKSHDNVTADGLRAGLKIVTDTLHDEMERGIKNKLVTKS